MKTPLDYYLYFIIYLAALFAVIHIFGKLIRRRKTMKRNRRFRIMNETAAKNLKRSLPDDISDRVTGIGNR